ncbi:hypothetical protein GN244_ATG15989 [Phytophthora infestans]|uniref:Uncharacterized protein n=1 Tax=Phytophthora infestans TaxID=4787 RepID=A0A833SIS2_PHYIN|nr:hypothetical protein GN244_ATG15989 [Phytophthora infestans]
MHFQTPTFPQDGKQSLYPPNIQILSDTVISSVRQHQKRETKVFSAQEIYDQTLDAPRLSR